MLSPVRMPHPRRVTLLYKPIRVLNIRCRTWPFQISVGGLREICSHPMEMPDADFLRQVDPIIQIFFACVSESANRYYLISSGLKVQT